MGTIDISYYNLFIGLLLLAIPFFYLWKFKTGLLKPAVIGTLRMIIQLFFIGIYLKYLFLWNNPWINFLWVIIMIFVAGQNSVGTYSTETEHLADTDFYRFFVQCSSGWIVLYRCCPPVR